MKKQDFEQIIGKEITTEQWKWVNVCYVSYSHLFPDDQSLVNFYNCNGFDVFRRLREDWLHWKNRNDDLDEETQKDKRGIEQSGDMDMTKEHLEQLLSSTLTDNEYFSVKECYSCYSGEHDLFESEDDFALFFDTFGMDCIRKLNCHCAREKAVEVLLREKARAEHQKYLEVCIKNSQLSSYISAFLKALVKFFNKILSDPLFSSNYNNSDYTKAFFVALIDYLNYEVERFEREVK